jgi:uncharacterized protein (TIGR03435 family)
MAQTPAFEVASVKPNRSGTTQANIGMLPNGVNFINLPLRAIIQFAYGINQASKLAGVPDWAVTERYDINARCRHCSRIDSSWSRDWNSVKSPFSR